MQVISVHIYIYIFMCMYIPIYIHTTRSCGSFAQLTWRKQATLMILDSFRAEYVSQNIMR